MQFAQILERLLAWRHREEDWAGAGDYTPPSFLIRVGRGSTEWEATGLLESPEAQKEQLKSSQSQPRQQPPRQRPLGRLYPLCSRSQLTRGDPCAVGGADRGQSPVQYRQR